MDRIDAINWMEQWAGRHGVELEPWRACRPGEERVGLVRMPRVGQLVPAEAMGELLAMGKQLTFKEMGEDVPPAAGCPSGLAAGSGDGGGGSSPLTNRGDKVTLEPFRGFGDGALFAAVDQFTLVGLGDESREAMKRTAQRYLGDGQAGLRGINTYAESWVFECGAQLVWSPGRRDWCFVATGRTLQLVGEQRHIEFILAVDAHRDHCTRVDPRIDDYSRKVIDLGQVRQAMEAGNFVGPRKCRVDQSNRLARGGGLEVEGATLYFGSRLSTLTRFYDKGLESKGLICSNRMEVEYRKEKADDAWVKLVNAARQGEAAFARAVGELVCGAVDFRERRGHRHVARMERLSWWASVVDRLGSLRLRVVQAVSTLNSSCGAMIRQYGKKLARAFVVAEAMGYDLALQLVQMIEHLRDGQELGDRDVSPLELAFQPVRAFKR